MTSREKMSETKNFGQLNNDISNSYASENETQRNSASFKEYSSLVVFNGSLEDACAAAFQASDISERRPVLLYITYEHGRYLVEENFCKDTLYSQAIIDYLNANYVVWSCDEAFESARTELIKSWQKMFSTSFFDHFPDRKYPLLIGVLRSFERNADGIAIPEYEFRLLLKVDILIRTRLKIDADNLLFELKQFQKTCHEIEKNPIFSFVETSGLAWEIVGEITKYLSFNDAVNAFSKEILPLIDHPQAKFHLSDPSTSFIKKIVPKITHGKIVSLELTADWCSIKNLDFLGYSKELISLAFHGMESMFLRHDQLIFYPNWTRLCLHYDHEVNYKTLENILYNFQHRLKQFELHCSGLYVDYGHYDEPKNLKKQMIMVDYFLLDISLHSSRPMYGFHDSYQRRYFIVEMHLMKTMPNLRYLHLIIDKNDIERICYFTIWETIVFIFSKLEKIRIDVRDSTFENKERLLQRALELQTSIRRIRDSFKLQIKVYDFT